MLEICNIMLKLIPEIRIFYTFLCILQSFFENVCTVVFRHKKTSAFVSHLTLTDAFLTISIISNILTACLLSLFQHDNNNNLRNDRIQHT